MIRLFRVYYPVRTLVLFVGEALVVWLAFFVGTLLHLVLSSQYGWLQLNNALFIEGGQLQLRSLALTGAVLLLSHGFDLYDSSQISARLVLVWRMLIVLAIVAAMLDFLPYLLSDANFPASEGLVLLIIALFAWRWAYSRMILLPVFRERLYVLGAGTRAQRLIRGLQERPDLGIDVVGWTGNVDGERTCETLAMHMAQLEQEKSIRVIVAMDDRRGRLPVEELLELKRKGVRVEEATSWLEKIYGRIEVEQLNPSWMIFTEGFRISRFRRVIRRVVNLAFAVVGLIVSLPLLPFVILAVRLSSPGPILYHQKRVGKGGNEFCCHKFRTMRQDAEADTGATWATDNDPRITRVGRFLRFWRLDEIPQLLCVLKGDMHFVGPRPERPEFVQWLSKEIPYYEFRHVVRPGITGWAQVRAAYANTLDDSREKLQYDLYYIKNASFGLDLWILFQTVKICLLGRGSRVKPMVTNEPATAASLTAAPLTAAPLAPEVNPEQVGTGT